MTRLLANVLIAILAAIFFVGCSGISIQDANDFFTTGGSSDNNFSQGFSAKFNSRTEEIPKTVSETLENIPIFSEEKHQRYFSFELGQDIYTPTDLEETALIEEENPYAGWLYGSIAKIDYTPELKETAGISLGVIGSWSFAEQTQTWFHEVIDSTEPNGWRNQLNNEFGVYLFYRRDDLTFKENWWGFDVITFDSILTRLGNVYTDVEYREELRVGKDVPVFEVEVYKPFSYFIFSNYSISTNARNIFYDGNTFEKSHRVSTKRYGLESQLGVAVIYKGWQVAFRGIVRSKDYDEQPTFFHTYGVLDIGRPFEFISDY